MIINYEKFKEFCITPGTDNSKKASSYVQAVKILFDFLNIQNNSINDNDMKRILNYKELLRSKDSDEYLNFLQFVTSRNQKSYLENGFINAAINYLHDYYIKNNILEKEMTENEKKSLVAFCFSKFNEEALNAFNYKSYSEAFDDFSLRISNVKDSYIKRRRDEFDVFFPNNGRVGFKNREPTPGVKEFFEKWNSYSFEQIVSLIKKSIFNSSENIYSNRLFPISGFITDSLNSRYILSLLAKSFVILSGNSGTGKTRIALRFAKYLETGINNTLLIPVGADWTDNTKILGYFNPLANEGKGEYVKSEILTFLELANENPSIPFFLILDEMNLSHVERYFSDFLSAMESGKPILLYKKPENCECAVPEKIMLPENLFVTGTVNIDETTYMFSPKVLDRANVIEFKPEMKDVLENLVSDSSSDKEETAEPGVAEGFMQLANKIRSGIVPDGLKAELEKLKSVLKSIYEILEKSGFEFSYRTAKEIRLYAVASYEICEDKSQFNINPVIDQQIVQKILPKIHGNKKQIGNLLSELKDELEKQEGFELSRAKVSSMIDKLDKYQYASFI